MNIKTTTDIKDAANFIAQRILEHVEKERVLWFVTGGSSIAVAIEAAKIISLHPHQNLTVMLTDERYGPVDHPSGNWHGLIAGGFSLPQAKLIPILTGDDRATTNKKFNDALAQELPKAGYKIGLFGVGVDGHTAGILPGSPAVHSDTWSVDYHTEMFERITMTPKTIELLDEAVVSMQGQEKWKVIEDLETKDLDLFTQPAQVLKKVPVCTLFTNYKK